MKKIIVSALILIGLISTSCDEVTNPTPSNANSNSELDWSLYPDGDSAAYVANGNWPAFSENTNTNRNVLIEDFTGHRCFNCPNAATLLKNLENANPGRVFGVGVHTSSNGISAFQEEDATYPTILYNDLAFEIGTYFGSIPGTSFLGNPHGAVNRTPNGADNTSGPGTWSSKTTVALGSTLKVNLQANSSYFPSTRGYFLHTEVDVLDNGLTNELAQVVYLVEDSIVGPQLMPDLSTNYTYLHHNVMRGCIDNRAFGKTITPYLNANGKYYLNYSFRLPDQYTATNMHVLIFVIDKVTNEIYQVIEEHIQ